MTLRTCITGLGAACVGLMLALFTGAAAPAPATAPAAKIRVLITDGYSNHNWKLTTQLLRGILEPTGLFDVAVSTAPPTATAPGWDQWRPKFSDYDVVIQTCNDLNRGPKWPEAVKADFEAFVTNGGGVFAHHSGNNAFPDWPAYNDMIGIGWRPASYGTAIKIDANGQMVRIPPGEGRSTGHAPRAAVLVHRLGDHPIHEGFPREWLTPGLEVYYDVRGPAKNIEILSYGLDPRYKEQWPLEWAVTYGKGRVYSSTFGHVWADDKQPESMRCADEQTLIMRVIQWLAKQPITVPVPKDFPTAEHISIRPEIPLPRP